MKALVVDDSRAMRTIVSRILGDVGVEEIIQAGNGQEALDALEALGSAPLPDVALVDWHMPVMNGLEFVQAVHARSDWRRMTIMMVTTEAEQDQIVRALTAGAHEYLMKPFSRESLVEKLELMGLVSVAPHPGGDPSGGIPS
jgi:two-component system chemotaxis response regulator CheY